MRTRNRSREKRGNTSVASIAKGETRTGLAGDSPSCGQKGQTHQRARRVAPLWLRRTPGTPGLSVPMVNRPPGIETSRGPRAVAPLSSVRVDAADSTAAARTATSSGIASRVNLSDPHPLRSKHTSDGNHCSFAIFMRTTPTSRRPRPVLLNRPPAPRQALPTTGRRTTGSIASQTQTWMYDESARLPQPDRRYWAVSRVASAGRRAQWALSLPSPSADNASLGDPCGTPRPPIAQGVERGASEPDRVQVLRAGASSAFHPRVQLRGISTC